LDHFKELLVLLTLLSSNFWRILRVFFVEIGLQIFVSLQIDSDLAVESERDHKSSGSEIIE
jgi:hypothetical protein